MTRNSPELQSYRWTVPPLFAPLLLTPVVVLVHGYHPFAGDAGIYVAGIRHILDPSLYPLNAAFPTAFTRLSVLPWVVAAVVRVTQLPLAWILLAAHLLSVFLFLFACFRLAARLFPGEASRWCAMLLAAACFTLPVAGTALSVMDPYITARSFSTPLSLLALAECVDRAWLRSVVLLILATLVHPLMGAYAAFFVLLCALVAAKRTGLAILACSALFAIAGGAILLAHGTVSPAYREAVDLPQRSFLFLARWHWYEILGLLLPVLLYALAIPRLRSAEAMRALCLTSVLCGITSLLLAALFVRPTGPATLVPLQVLRNFHFIYTMGIVLCGGILAGLIFRSRIAGFSLLALIFAGMAVTQSRAWPGCNHIEWPGARPANPWQQAFLWIRDNTPHDAVFAFNPELLYLPEEDEQGFRAIAERDHLADDKDAGIVAVLPRLAERWSLQRDAQLNVDGMTDAQRMAALTPLGATWILLAPQAETQFSCPYRNGVVVVCRMAR